VPDRNAGTPPATIEKAKIMSTGTVRLHRVLRAKPEKVYRAFIDADAMAKWIPPCDFTCKVQQMDTRTGGTFKMAFTNFTTGMSHSFGGKYLALVQGEKLRHTDVFDDPKLPGEMQTTVTLKPVLCGTAINVVQEGIPESSRRRCVTSAGRSRWNNRRKWLSRKFRSNTMAPEMTITPMDSRK
jgi:uncharacterized protein YndB with AHSA1/START domain